MLAQGAEPIGWKIGFNVSAAQQKLGIDAPLAGFLTTDGLFEDGAEVSLDDGPLVVESEVAVELGDDARSIVALLPALEVADPPDLDQDVETILAGNIFHRAVAFGPRVETARARRRPHPRQRRGRARDGAGGDRRPPGGHGRGRPAPPGGRRRGPRPRASASSPASSPRPTPPTRATACGSSSTSWAASSCASPRFRGHDDRLSPAGRPLRRRPLVRRRARTAC